MKTIKMYSANAQSSDGGAPKGSSGNPYTQEEYESMLDAGTWPAMCREWGTFSHV